MKYLLLSFLCYLSIPLSAQQLKVPTLSPHSEIKQEVGLTEIILSYNRPNANGRTIFGELIPYGEIWRTGANAATKLTFTEEVQIANHPVPAGTYALYTIPNQEEWTIIIHTKTNLWSIAGGRVKPENDLCRFAAKSIPNPIREETFTMQFKEVHAKGLTVELAWENTIVRFPITVEVDKKVAEQMDRLLQDPEEISPRDYYFAAEYNFYNEKELDQAIAWLDAALMKSPNNFRHGLLKARILSKQGEKVAAFESAIQSQQWAIADENAHYIGQTTLFLQSLATPEEQVSSEFVAAKSVIPSEQQASTNLEVEKNVTTPEKQKSSDLVVDKSVTTPEEQESSDLVVEQKVSITKDIDYVVDVDYDQQKDLLDIYMPEGKKDVPVIVYFHGGAPVSYTHLTLPTTPYV